MHKWPDVTGAKEGDSMKSIARKCLAGLMLLAALAVTVQLVAQEQQKQLTKQTYYSVKDLGTLGGTGGVAEGISDRGWVVGDANLAGDQSGHAFLWRDGVM